MEMSFLVFFAGVLCFIDVDESSKPPTFSTLRDDYIKTGSCVFAREQQNITARFSCAFSFSQSLFTDFVEIKSRSYFLPR